jgi:hypothetical protein
VKLVRIFVKTLPNPNCSLRFTLDLKTHRTFDNVPDYGTGVAMRVRETGRRIRSFFDSDLQPISVELRQPLYKDGPYSRLVCMIGPSGRLRRSKRYCRYDCRHHNLVSEPHVDSPQSGR